MKKPTCVQCHKELSMQIDDKAFTNAIFVCVNPECSNYGLLAICQEKMPAEKFFEKANYKGKYFYITDEIDDEYFDSYSIGKISKREALDKRFIELHKQTCLYYGIPTYIGKDKKMLEIYG